jgi:hypothetical protein
VEDIVPGSGHSWTGGEEMEAVLNQGRTVRTGRGRSILEAMVPLHGEEEVMESPEMEVYSHWRQEGGQQPLPDEVPREQRELELDAGEWLVSRPVLVDAGGLGGLQEGRVYVGRPAASIRKSWRAANLGGSWPVRGMAPSGRGIRPWRSSPIQ